MEKEEEQEQEQEQEEATTPRWKCVVLSSNANLRANLFAAVSTFHFRLLIKI